MYARFDTLPKATQLKLLEIQSDDSLLGITKFNESSRRLAVFGILICIGGIAYVFAKTDDFHWTSSDQLWHCFIAAFSTTCGWLGFNYLSKYYSNVLKEFIYVNPI
jgi:hypothetical protein